MVGREKEEGERDERIEFLGAAAPIRPGRRPHWWFDVPGSPSPLLPSSLVFSSPSCYRCSLLSLFDLTVLLFYGCSLLQEALLSPVPEP